MKILSAFFLLAIVAGASTVTAQRRSPPTAPTSGDYASDVSTVAESQRQALEQAKDMLEQTESVTARAALQTAIKEMEAAEKALEAAKKNPADLRAAETDEQAAYQALLKAVPHEFKVTRSKRGSQSGGRSGQPGEQQMQQLELTSEENRYETERQATVAPNAAQKEQLEAADRLKQLSQRQQDLNDRLRELQTALQAAKTEQEQEEIKRELKHLADEERQMLTDMDDLKQKLDQSSNASSLSQTSRDLEQTRSETQRAAQALENQSVSQALASGTRAQQSMQNARENLRNQTSSQFSNQMRDLQSKARDLAKNEEDVAHTMQEMENGEQKTLDNNGQRQQLVQKMNQQQSALTNLLGQLQDVTEKSETTEPLLYEQLYDTLRRAGQMHTESLLDTSSQLVDSGFLNKAAEAENAARTNINELRARVEHAAESVLGSQSQALRYAQQELNDLTKEVEHGLGNTNFIAAGSPGAGTNLASSSRQGRERSAVSGEGTNSEPSNVQANARSNGGRDGTNSPSGEQASANSRERGANPAQRGQNGSQPGQNGDSNSPNGQQAGDNSPNGQRDGNNQQSDQQNGGGNGGDRLRDLVRQSGGANGGGVPTGPIVDNFANWADRMRDVEQVIDSVDMRNRLADVRERVAAYRAGYRYRGVKPTYQEVKDKVVQPMTEIRNEIQEDIARLENARSLVPLDHDPVPDNYSELVRKYYEKLGGGQ